MFVDFFLRFYYAPLAEVFRDYLYVFICALGYSYLDRLFTIQFHRDIEDFPADHIANWRSIAPPPREVDSYWRSCAANLRSPNL